MADSDVWKDAEQAYETVRERDAEQGLVWLTPASANNTWAMSVRRDVAEAHDLETLDDLATYLEDGGEFKFAASAEFVESEQALPAFQQAYGFELVKISCWCFPAATRQPPCARLRNRPAVSMRR